MKLANLSLRWHRSTMQDGVTCRRAVHRKVTYVNDVPNSAGCTPQAYLKAIFSDTVRWQCSASIVDQTVQLAA